MPDLDRLVAGLRCRDVLADLSDYIDGDLPPARVVAVQAHLAGCDTCAQFGGFIGEIVSALQAERDLAPRLGESEMAALRDRVQHAIGHKG